MRRGGRWGGEGADQGWWKAVDRAGGAPGGGSYRRAAARAVDGTSSASRCVRIAREGYCDCHMPPWLPRRAGERPPTAVGEIDTAACTSTSSMRFLLAP